MMQVHASCVAISETGILLRGPSGCGKSDLALRLIDGGAALVADDRVDLARVDNRLVASPPAGIAGMIEVRGLGVVRMRHREKAVVRLVVDLVPEESAERIPAPTFCDYMETTLPCLRLVPFEESAAAKVRIAVAIARGDIATVDAIVDREP
jgi:HPr kinase/phosphorylase